MLKSLFLKYYEIICVIHELKDGVKQITVCQFFYYISMKVGTIWKNKDKIIQTYNERSSFKKIQSLKFEQIDEAVLQWYSTKLLVNIGLSISKATMTVKKVSFVTKLNTLI